MIFAKPEEPFAYAVAWITNNKRGDGDFVVTEWPCPGAHLVAGPYPTQAEAEHAFLTWPGVRITGRRQSA